MIFNKIESLKNKKYIISKLKIAHCLKLLISEFFEGEKKIMIDGKAKEEKKNLMDALEIINRIIFEYLINTVKHIKEEYESFDKDKANKKDAFKKIIKPFLGIMDEALQDVLEPHETKLFLPISDILSKLGINDKESFTISNYLNELRKNIINTDNKKTLSKPQLKQIYWIIDAYISPKKDKKKQDMIYEMNNNINQEINKDCNDLCSFEDEILNNKK